MEKMNPTLEKTFVFLLYGALCALSLGLVTSTSILSLSHILIAVPLIYFIFQTHLKDISKSSWALLGMSLAIVLSVFFNQDIAVNGLKPALKVKYFLFGFFSITPLAWFFKNHSSEKKIKFLLYAFCVATTIATIAGIVGMKTGFNYISMRKVNFDRNAGLSGMVLNYAHNLAYFQIIILGLIFLKKEIKSLINQKFLIAFFLFNFIGLYLSFTRGAMLALVVGIPFYFFKPNKKKFILTGLVLVALASAVFFISGKSLLRPASDRERISQWQAALKAFEERPILGYGYLNFEQHSVPIKKRYNLGEYQFGGHAHNNFLEMLASTGIVGFLCYVAWLVFWGWEMFKRDDPIAKISLPFIIVFIVGGLTQSTVSLGVNLFFVMAVYTIGQLNVKNNS